jgi:5,10-methylenetetrahydromethanopterin reductase
MDVGVLLFAVPRQAAALAQLVEGLGFSGVLFADSQNLLPEVWGQLMLAAAATSRVVLGPGVTNSVTRDAAVTASAALALQVESGGRALVGIGRGDSAVQRIGKHEDPVASFERYLVALQAYLAGEAVDRDGFASRLEWQPRAAVPKPPVMVAATGRRVVEVAARRADDVCLAVGADADHVAAVLAHAREAARVTGRDPARLRWGAFVNCLVHEDTGVARDAVRGSAASFARFSALAGSRLAALPPPLAAAARWLREHYDMREHTRTGVPHTAGIGDDFVDWFAVAGTAAHARERLRRLAAVGLDFVWIVPGSSNIPRDVALGSLRSLAAEVVPALATGVT